MKKKNVLFKLLLLSISSILLLNLIACDSLNPKTEDTLRQTNEDTKKAEGDEDEKTGQNADLMFGVEADELDPTTDMVTADFMQEFSVDMLQALTKDSRENVLFSPLSIYSALGMTQNAAANRTLEQMIEVLKADPETLNQYLYSYKVLTDQQTEGVKLSLANSLWLNEDMQDDVEVRQDFLQTNATYYDTALYNVGFNEETKDLINSWVEDNTDQMIPEIIDQIPPDALLYLINALAFEGQWKEKYEREDIKEALFFNEDYSESEDILMMHSVENLYFSDEQAQGFLKPYKDSRYAFMAILPNDGIGLTQYINNLKKDSFADLLNSVTEEEVKTGIPQFSVEYSKELSGSFKELGMVDAFELGLADFSKGFEPADNILISRILHSTFIEVDAEGTKAAAATAVEIERMMAPLEEKKVILDRPFLYLIIDRELQVPIFVGQILSIDE